jgi:hypothetical protein
LYNSTVPGDALLRRTGIRTRHPFDFLWWLVAGAASLVAARVPELLTPVEQTGPQFASHVVLFFVGALLGTLRPARAWRWGLASFLALGFADIVHLGNDLHFPETDPGHLWMHFTNGAGDWAMHSLLVLAGAYAGSLLVSKGVK